MIILVRKTKNVALDVVDRCSFLCFPHTSCYSHIFPAITRAKASVALVRSFVAMGAHQLAIRRASVIPDGVINGRRERNVLSKSVAVNLGSAASDERLPGHFSRLKDELLGTTSDFCGSKKVASPQCSDGNSINGRTIGYYEGWNYQRKCGSTTLTLILIEKSADEVAQRWHPRISH